MLKNFAFVTMGLVALGFAGCRVAAIEAASGEGQESCYDVGGGMLQCVSTPAAVTRGATDVDGDGRPDPFVCANGRKGLHQRDGARADDDQPRGDGGKRDDQGRHDDDDDGIDDDDDCDRRGCIAVGDRDDDRDPYTKYSDHSGPGRGGESSDGGKADDDDHSGPGRGGRGADGGDDKHGGPDEAHGNHDGGAKRDDADDKGGDHAGKRGTVMMCSDGGIRHPASSDGASRGP